MVTDRGFEIVQQNLSLFFISYKIYAPLNLLFKCTEFEILLMSFVVFFIGDSSTDEN